MRSLSHITADDLQECGGKAVQLARLAQEGLPVPDALVVPASVFRQALAAHGLLARAEAVGRGETDAALPQDIRGISLTAAVRKDWGKQAKRLGSHLAVRSSGIDEDGVHTSFAGQHDSFLHVAPREVPQAILDCWASLYNPHALAYRTQGPSPGALAVLVQKQLSPRTAGVLFTINPLNGSWREMVVESVWGLGESLVSGQVHPHWFLVRRPRQLPKSLRWFRRVTARVRLSVMQRDLPELTRQATGSSTGITHTAVPARRRKRPTLDDARLKRLCRLGLQVERKLGSPQDIEWAEQDGRFYILQARPITAAGSPRTRDDVLWTRRFIGERWPQPATPLGWSLFQPLIDDLIGYPETQAAHLGGGPSLRLVDGRPYINATIFRHLAFKLPGAPPPRFMLELIPPEEEEDWHRRFAVAPHVAVYASIFRTTFQERRWQRFRYNPFTNPSHWDRFQADLKQALPSLEAIPTADSDVLTHLDLQMDWIRTYCSIHVCSLLFANIGYQLLEGALASWLPLRRKELLPIFGSSPPGNLTVATHTALAELAQHANPDDLQRLQSGAAEGPFAEALATFLGAYGHRAEASWELMAPHWCDTPAQLVPFLQNPSAPPAASTDEDVQTLLDDLTPELTPAQAHTLGVLVPLVRTYMLLRENQRFWFDHLLAATRGTLLALGDQLVATGSLSERELVSYLDIHTLRDAIKNPVPLDAVARAAQQEWQTNAARQPPTFLCGDDPAAAPTEGPRLQGLGISAGRHRGRVRVLHSSAEGASLLPGEILVARAVDPGWTPLFSRAGAMVLELGSVLSHGAVIAREYKLPAVVNLDGITERLTTGMDVTVDGDRGRIWIHDPI